MNTHLCMIDHTTHLYNRHYRFQLIYYKLHFQLLRTSSNGYYTDFDKFAHNTQVDMSNKFQIIFHNLCKCLHKVFCIECHKNQTCSYMCIHHYPYHTNCQNNFHYIVNYTSHRTTPLHSYLNIAQLDVHRK